MAIPYIAFVLSAISASTPDPAEDFGWIRGANYVPSYARNDVQLWMDYDPTIIDRELGFAANLRLNCVRVFLQQAVYDHDPKRFLDRFENLLSLSVKYQIKVMPVLFDSCFGGDPTLDREKYPHYGWMPSPGQSHIAREHWEASERFARDVVAKHRDDPRVVMWDVMNEHHHNNLRDKPAERKQFGRNVDEFLLHMIDFVKSLKPQQPVTAGMTYLRQLPLVQDKVDVLSFHNYSLKGEQGGLAEELHQAKKLGRQLGKPVVLSEAVMYPHQPFTFAMPILHAENIGWLFWELMIGRTHFSMGQPPKQGLIYPDGTCYDARDVAAVMDVSLEEARKAFPPRDTNESPVRVVADQSRGTILDAVYGQFIEHLGYCIHGPIGLWAEIVQDRKFYEDFTNPAAQRPGGWARSWVHHQGMVRTDRVKTHSGAWCLELLPGGDTLRGWNGFGLDPAPGKQRVSVEGWVMRGEARDDGNPLLTLQAMDAQQKRTPFPLSDLVGAAVAPGTWHAFRREVELPEGTRSLLVELAFQNGPAKRGSVFLDDLRISAHGVTKGPANGDFESAQKDKAGNWSASGAVAFVRGREAFVGNQSPQLAANASIRQDGIALRQDVDYKGRIVLHGETGAVCEVTLRDTSGFTRTVRLSGLGAGWETRPLSFACDRVVTNASLEISAHVGAVTLGAVSLMPADNIAGFRRDIVEKMKELDAPNYRWPGGCYVASWQWKAQLGDRDKRAPSNADEANDVGLHEFIALCKELEAEPVICVNTGRFGEHGTPEYNRDLVLYCNSAGTPMAEWRARNGHPKPFNVKLWAIGNEMFGHWQHGHYDTVEQYAEKHNQTVAAMRSADPAIQVIAVGNSNQMKNSKHAEWNRTMFQRCAATTDFISEHFYSTAASLRGKDLFGHMTDLRDNLQACLDHYRRLYKETGVVKPVMLDEWNYWYGPNVYGDVGPAYFHKDGIGVAAGLHTIFRNADIVAGCNFAQTVNVLGAICANRTDSVISATGLPLVLYRQHFGKHLVKVENADPKLEAVAAWTSDRKALTVALINFDKEAKTVPLVLEGVEAAATGAEWYFIQHADPAVQNVPGREPALRIEQRSLPSPLTDVQIAPYSINVFVLPMTAVAEHRLVAPSKPPSKPNIVLIMADDMGFSDLGCYGSEIPTPNLDALAAGGLRFTQFYNSARCAPTRAALLTGLHPHQAGVGRLPGTPSPDDPPGYLGYLNQRCVTLAEVLRTAGYRTYMSGKWHVGHTEPEQWPLQRGFDRFYGIADGAASYLQPKNLLLDNKRLPPPSNVGTGADDYYLTDAFTDHAIQTIREHQDGVPFFLYLAFTAPHWPLQAKAEDIARFVGKYCGGWDTLRAARHARQIELGIVNKDGSLSVRDSGARAWDSLTEQEKSDLDYRMAVYAAQVHRMDSNIGRLVAALRERGQLDNTLLLFLSDNGGCAEPYSDLGGREMKDINDPAVTRSCSYGTGWANLSNTPFRKFKSMLEEGGIATPLIAHWPAGLKTRPGQCDATPGYLTDLMPTFLEVSGAAYPKERKGQALFPLEGRSLLPVLSGSAAATVPRLLFWEQYGNKAVREGEWKALCRAAPNTKWELYNLAQDRTELRDLAAEHPGKVKELADQWNVWAERAQAFPYPGMKGEGGARQ